MKQRMIYGWNIRRILYLAGGIAAVIYSAIESQWWSLLFGGYFAAMGLFGFGCASGACSRDKFAQSPLFKEEETQ